MSLAYRDLPQPNALYCGQCVKSAVNLDGAGADCTSYWILPYKPFWYYKSGMGSPRSYTLGWHVPVPPDILMEPLLTPEQLAAALGLSVQTLYNRRARGESLPPCIKLGRQLRFFQADVQNWLEAQRDGSGVCLADPLREPGQTHQAGPPRRRGRPTKSDEIRRRSPLLA
ncbi:helix-turn-helix transcriptional regulator [Achromobacter dolens]|uniref:helix-turn-helix transcriptional regulator n=1 Tax=Achromobacter dolens TaxID=1287738 RepID=UPI003AB1FA45